MAADTYVVRRGDSLTSIAARLYGDPTFWLDLANVNGLRDPRNVVAGQVIRLLP